jgi:hypothetical protein
MTTLAGKSPGDPFNLEVDILGRYVERLLRKSGTLGRSDISGSGKEEDVSLSIEELISQGF